MSFWSGLFDTFTKIDEKLTEQNRLLRQLLQTPPKKIPEEGEKEGEGEREGIGRQLNYQTRLLERIAENYPEINSVRIYSGDTDVVAGGTSLTVTFELDWEHWRIKITELYADERTDCDYTWKFRGSTYNLNEVTFDFGAKAVEDTYHKIELTVDNTGTDDKEVGYYTKGWAVKKE